MLLQYFGENSTKDCGKCDVCVEKKRGEKGAPAMKTIIHEVLVVIENGESRVEGVLASVHYSEKQVVDALRFLSDSEQIVINDHEIHKI